MKRDYQTAGGGTLPDGSPYGVRRANDARGDTVLSDRYYLADADFLVGLESGDAALLRRLHDALQNPVWQLYLGRKAFVPSVPVHNLTKTCLVRRPARSAWPTAPQAGEGLLIQRSSASRFSLSLSPRMWG